MAGESFLGVRVQGGLIPAELLSRIAAGALEGQKSADYHLAPGETVREAANRAWAYLTGVWATYRQAAERLPKSDRGTTLTRERWLLIFLRELGFGRVSAAPAGGLHADGKHAPVSHLWEHVPIHLLGHRIDLDRRTQGVAGAARSSPQSMVQELLNRSDQHLWAVLSNGMTLRLLRDSTSLVGSSYVEFDLEAIFDGDSFADFLLLFSLCHESRLQVRDEEKGSASCWLETWRTGSIESGSRALDQLRDGVIAAITTLGTGFLAHPGNAHLRDQLAQSHLRIEDVNHALLRVVYRLLFTFVAEDRGLLLSPDADPSARSRYDDYFSTARLRRVSRRRRGTRHTDQWRALNIVWEGLGSEAGRPELGLVGIGGVFDAGPLDTFRTAELSNEALLRAVRQLSLVEEPGSGVKRVVDYRNLGAEELGSIYETLLEFVPTWDAGTRTFALFAAAGNDRKSTGSYYTPTSLIDSLLDSALDPVLDRAEESPDSEAALLALTVCDPACGSGHFLVAAARRIAKRVAAIRTGDPEPPPGRVREALSDVVGNCIYGVDVNPLAAELAKISLWLETLDPGRPLAFLDAQIKVGNSLMGTTPALIAEGVPDMAFAALEGDDKKIVTGLQKQNKVERAGQDELFDSPASIIDPELARQLEGLIGGVGTSSLAAVHSRRQKLEALESDPVLQRIRLVADAWCAAFFWPKHPGGPRAVTDAVIRALERGGNLPAGTAETVQDLVTEYKFFHWHVEFPHLFRPSKAEGGFGGEGGFDVILGNPPWERIALEDKSFFETRAPEVLEGTTAQRKSAIANLSQSDPAVHNEYRDEGYKRRQISNFMTGSALYRYGAVGRLTTQALFTERSFHLVRRKGMVGLVITTGVLTDTPMKKFWAWLVDTRRIQSIVDFENSSKIFPIHSSYNFSLFTANGGEAWENRPMTVALRLTSVDELNIADRIYALNPEDLVAVNPITKQLPVCKFQWEVDLLVRITRTIKSIPSRGWVGFTSSGNSAVYRSEPGSDLVALYEGKLMHQHNASFTTYAGVGVEDLRAGNPRPIKDWDHGRPTWPRYWVEEHIVKNFLSSKKVPSLDWVLAVRDYARGTDDRTVIAAILPTTVPIQPLNGVTNQTTEDAAFCVASMNSFCYDWTARQRIPGQHFNVTIMTQTPPFYPLLQYRELVLKRCIELAYTLPSLSSFARDCGVTREPYPWDRDRRELLARELDAVYFVSAGVERAEVVHIMDSFRVRRGYEESSFGQYRSRRLILEFFDKMQAAIAAGRPYRSRLEEEQP